MTAKKQRPKACRSCRAELAPDALPGVVRCESCQPKFEAWLRGDHPTTYTPRRDGVWADLARQPSED